ncbi:TPA: hypothetical protein MFD46_002808 [Klebsiella pneumoniae]|uniref:Uncharacterized protein n=1 Tax=Klebsiella pneumoniae TaxID=573 RepID=A0A486D4C2_KLEPN|nr:hypothetical protein [Klebsiella pneumoniae]VGG88250.1 Uncharacterised protein [Klebsiella pneumoniae]VGH00019.1 Uncharacterised protein [Klebsiella pneumoniae]VGH02361.1 Uncharacterised protein [Klebsiella pneumoniae]VGI31619.1 Uncharacterised protein [Klebsiella pneumoniae]VGJ62310.1 Uncharacterised protein [Klebsiella pneumoniae]
MNIKEIGNVFHCDCGFSWHRGKNGNHNCADGLREKVRQLAAENVALKSAITDHSHSVHFCEVCGKDDPCSTDDVCYALKDTPATDRIVAGIKADGVEEFVSNTVHKIFDESEAVSALAYLSLANSHVKKLREGADK